MPQRVYGLKTGSGWTVEGTQGSENLVLYVLNVELTGFTGELVVRCKEDRIQGLPLG